MSFDRAALFPCRAAAELIKELRDSKWLPPFDVCLFLSEVRHLFYRTQNFPYLCEKLMKFMLKLHLLSSQWLL